MVAIIEMGDADVNATIDAFFMFVYFFILISLVIFSTDLSWVLLSIWILIQTNTNLISSTLVSITNPRKRNRNLTTLTLLLKCKWRRFWVPLSAHLPREAQAWGRRGWAWGTWPHDGSPCPHRAPNSASPSSTCPLLELDDLSRRDCRLLSKISFLRLQLTIFYRINNCGGDPPALPPGTAGGPPNPPSGHPPVQVPPGGKANNN